MTEAFKLLATLLDRAESEVEGRSLETPPEAVKSRLRDFARGMLAETERAELIGQLKQNRHWIALLAEEIKASRKPHRDEPRHSL